MFETKGEGFWGQVQGQGQATSIQGHGQGHGC